MQKEEKTRVVDLTKGERFGFLGFDFRRVRSVSGTWRPQYTPKLKKRTALLERAGYFDSVSGRGHPHAPHIPGS